MKELTESGELVGVDGAGRPVEHQDGPAARRRRRRSPTGRSARPRSTWPASASSTARASSGRSRSPRRSPDARYTAIEVRPVMDAAGDGDVSAGGRRRGPAARSWRRRSSARSSAATASSTPCEDAVQEALLAAARPVARARACPDNPRGWLITVAVAPADRPAAQRARPAGAARRRPPPRRRRTSRRRRRRRRGPRDRDDTLTLLFLCCHPALSPPSQVALTLRAVGGLTTAQIARAFLVPEATMAQRISRAKQTHQGRRRARSRMPPADRAGRAAAGRAARPLPDLQRGLHGHAPGPTCSAPT